METLELVSGAITAMGALGLAAFALVDAMKAWPGGFSNVGFRHIRDGCQPFTAALSNGAGKRTGSSGDANTATWEELLRAQWRNGRDKDAQKGLVRALVRIGLTDGQTDDIARFCNVDVDKMNALVKKLKLGGDPTIEEGNMLGRIDAVIGFQIDAAFERADQRYRNVARTTAGGVAILLGIGGAFLINVGCDATTTDGAAATCASAVGDQVWWRTLWLGVAAGILAVPIAPIAKDLTSSLSAAVTAVKAVRGR